jgi:hypothetical protein
MRKRKSICDFSGTVFARERSCNEKGKICSVEILIQNRGKMIVFKLHRVLLFVFVKVFSRAKKTEIVIKSPA